IDYHRVRSSFPTRRSSDLRLREADRRKDEFLALLAHELRNPLAPIANAAELLARGKLDAQALARTSEIIRRQAQHMTRLIDDLRSEEHTSELQSRENLVCG